MKMDIGNSGSLLIGAVLGLTQSHHLHLARRQLLYALTQPLLVLFPFELTQIGRAHV